MDRQIQNLPKGVCLDTFNQADQSCPSCNSKGLSIFYAVDEVPVHSCLLMSSRDRALNYPRGKLQLGFCTGCGFIANTRFDPGVHNYSAQYEETQGFSTCFNAFAKSLAQRLIDKYSIRNRTVLEIGCGKGEFLTLLCQLGANRGIGIDPAYVPERNPAADDPRVEFVQDFYSEKHACLTTDVICCRHTLEHIPSTLEFMQTIRNTIADRKDTLVFFEVPDVMRVLREGAFWDIYYEHCSYFTMGSLARLFRVSGFKIDDLYLDYDGQYIMITAYPTDSPHSRNLSVEEDVRVLGQQCKKFREKCVEKISFWRNTVQQIAGNQKTVIWGSGSKGVAFLTTLRLTGEIEYVVDINPYKHGKYMPGTGQKIVSPHFLKEYKPHRIIVMNQIYSDEILKELERLNIRAELIPV
jgi:SAM-dependent methyltransferase